VFDLYVGDQPVSSEARTTALLAAQRMIASGACTAVLSALLRRAAVDDALHGQVRMQMLSLAECQSDLGTSEHQLLAAGPDGYAPAAGQPGVCQGVGSSGSGDACKRRWPWEKPWHTAFNPAAA
jgi:hypothetical protein